MLRQCTACPIRFGTTKIICVGNYTIGGSGKTQIVIWLAKQLANFNIDFVIVTKAYNSKLTCKAVLLDDSHKASEVGDESVMLMEYGRVIAAPDIRLINNILCDLKPKVAIIDDGLQSPHFYKDIKILVEDVARLNNGFLIPAGPLRENKKLAKKAADIICAIDAQFINKPSCSVDFAASATENIDYVVAEYKPLHENKMGFKKSICNKKYFTFSSYIDSVQEHDFAANSIKIIDADTIKSLHLLAFASIGNPSKFFTALSQNGCVLNKTKNFPDHHQYSQEELLSLFSMSNELGLVLITTEKDIVKIKEESSLLKKLSVKILVVKVSILAPDQDSARILNIIRQKNISI